MIFMKEVHSAIIKMTSWSTSHHEKHNYVNWAFEPVINNYAFKLDLILTKVSKGKNSQSNVNSSVKYFEDLQICGSKSMEHTF